jgi:hypothetical protein
MFPDNAPKSWDIHDGWETTMRDVVWSLDDNQPRFRHQKWKDVFDEQNRSNPLTLHFADPLFSLPVGDLLLEYETRLSRDDVWKRLRTLSQIAVMEGDQLQQTEKTFLDATEDKSNPVGEDGLIALHGKTQLAWTSRIPDVPLRSGG